MGHKIESEPEEEHINSFFFLDSLRHLEKCTFYTLNMDFGFEVI